MSSGASQTQWIYEPSVDGRARFVLGTVGDNPLICFGINPSTAVPNELDRTANRVVTFAKDNGYDSWIMLNVYAQIETKPELLPAQPIAGLKELNERHISKVLAGHSGALLAAWGDDIGRRPYLRPMLSDILRLPEVLGRTWLALDTPTIPGNPRHPLYVRKVAAMVSYDVSRYLSPTI